MEWNSKEKQTRSQAIKEAAVSVVSKQKYNNNSFEGILREEADDGKKNGDGITRKRKDATSTFEEAR